MNICRWIDWWANRTPDKAALRHERGTVSYREFRANIAKTAATLQSLGVGEGQRVAWLGYNGPEFLTTFFACAHLGAIIVPLNLRLAPREHLYIVRNVDATLLFFDADFQETADLIKDECSCRTVPIFERDMDSRGTSLATLLKASYPSATRASDCWLKPVLIVFTSGTTGRPKGATLTHRNIHWNALNSRVMHDFQPNDHVLTTLPFFHVGGLNIQTTPALHAGATVTLVEKFHAGKFLTFVETRRPTLTVLVPTQMQAIAAHPRWRSTDLSSLRCVTTGSTIVQRPLLDIWHDHEIPVIQIYGATETGPIAIHQTIEAAHASSGSIGRPAMYCDVRIVDSAGQDLSQGQAG